MQADPHFPKCHVRAHCVGGEVGVVNKIIEFFHFLELIFRLLPFICIQKGLVWVQKILLCRQKLKEEWGLHPCRNPGTKKKFSQGPFLTVQSLSIQLIPEWIQIPAPNKANPSVLFCWVCQLGLDFSQYENWNNYFLSPVFWIVLVLWFFNKHDSSLSEVYFEFHKFYSIV